MLGKSRKTTTWFASILGKTAGKATNKDAHAVDFPNRFLFILIKLTIACYQWKNGKSATNFILNIILPTTLFFHINSERNFQEILYENWRKIKFSRILYQLYHHPSNYTPQRDVTETQVSVLLHVTFQRLATQHLCGKSFQKLSFGYFPSTFFLYLCTSYKRKGMSKSFSYSLFRLSVFVNFWFSFTI